MLRVNYRRNFLFSLFSDPNSRAEFTMEQRQAKEGLNFNVSAWRRPLIKSIRPEQIYFVNLTE